MLKKRQYTPFIIEKLCMESAGAVMTGSVTNTPIEVGNVTVDAYQNGFDTDPFKEVSLN